MTYSISFRKSAAKELEHLPGKFVKKITDEIFALAQKNSAGESTLGFQGFHCSRIGRVLVHVDDPRNGVGG